MKTLYESILSSVDESILSSSGAGKAKVDAEYKKYGLDPSKVTANPDGTIDYDGDIDLIQHGLKRIPFDFNKVNGHFTCSYNNLTTLDGCPKIVNGSFACAYNELTTLEGGPLTVSGTFNCSGNKLTDLKGGPEIVGGLYLCVDNDFNFNLWEFFDHMPVSVNGDFISSTPHSVGVDMETLKKRIKKCAHVKGAVKISIRK